MLLLLTNSCRMGCSHCFSDCVPTSQHMSLETLNSIIQYINKACISNLVFSGGEPTEHPHFAEYIQEVIDNSDHLGYCFIASNGIFVDDLQKTDQIKELLSRNENLFLQITNVPQFYPRKDILQKIKKLNLGNKLQITTHLDSLTLLGRALKNHSNHQSIRAPCCINFYLLSRQGFNDFHHMINYLELTTLTSFCKPMVDMNGHLHLGEYLKCIDLGHLSHVNPESIASNLKSSLPCDLCKNYKNIDQKVRSLLENTTKKSRF